MFHGQSEVCGELERWGTGSQDPGEGRGSTAGGL